VELASLGEQDFVRILREPKNSLIKQYTALLRADGVELEFTDGAIAALAAGATRANSESQNIGARRLHTVIEKLLEDVSFEAPYEGQALPSRADATAAKDGEPPAAPASASGGAARVIRIDEDFVTTRLAKLTKDKEVADYIL
jgi:ATP-dependent protease HslVU (ClpYQ) ATPase subunit